MFGYDLGIDLGTSSIVISVVGKCFMPVSVLITLKAENLSA